LVMVDSYVTPKYVPHLTNLAFTEGLLPHTNFAVRPDHDSVIVDDYHNLGSKASIAGHKQKKPKQWKWMSFLEEREAYVLDLEGREIDVREDGQHWFHLSGRLFQKSQTSELR